MEHSPPRKYGALRPQLQPKAPCTTSLLILILLVLQGCGGGGSSGDGNDSENWAPILGNIGDQSVDEGTDIDVELSASDRDGGPLSFEAPELPPFVSFEILGDNTALLSVAPDFDDSGDYAIMVRVSDGHSLADQETFTLSIADVNRAPALMAMGDQRIAEGQAQVIALNAADADGDGIILSGHELPSFASVHDDGDGIGTLTLQPGFNDSGDYPITVRATDSGSLTNQQTFTLSVADVNRAPALMVMGDQRIAEGQAQVIALNAADADGDGIILSGQGLPSFTSLRDNGDGTGTLTLQPGFNDSGDYPITVRATDSGSLTNQQTFTLSVADVNRAPMLTAVGDQTIEEDQTGAVALNAADADGDNIILSGHGLPSFTSLRDNGDETGTLTLQPGFNDSGDYPITVRATDSGSLTNHQTFTLSVADVNRAPMLTTIGNQTIEEGQTQVIALNATDADGDTIALGSEDLPSFVSVDDNGDGTGTLTVQPDFDDGGEYSITMHATDSNSTTDQQSFTLSVADVNRAPGLTAIGDQMIEEDQTHVIALNATDADGDGVDA